MPAVCPSSLLVFLSSGRESTHYFLYLLSTSITPCSSCFVFRSIPFPFLCRLGAGYKDINSSRESLLPIVCSHAQYPNSQPTVAGKGNSRTSSCRPTAGPVQLAHTDDLGRESSEFGSQILTNLLNVSRLRLFGYMWQIFRRIAKDIKPAPIQNACKHYPQNSFKTSIWIQYFSLTFIIRSHFSRNIQPSSNTHMENCCLKSFILEEL